MKRFPAPFARAIASSALVVACGSAQPTHPPTSTDGSNASRGDASRPLPADEAAIATKLRDPAALGHVRGFAVDESCFDIQRIPDGLSQNEPLHLSMANVGGVNIATIVETSPEAFGRLMDWTLLFPKSTKRHFVYSRSFDNGAIKGWMATCVLDPPIVEDGDFGRVVHKDAALNTARLDIAFSEPALIRMKTLPPNIQRIVFLYDATDVLSTVFLDDLRKLAHPVLTLVKF